MNNSLNDSFEWWFKYRANVNELVCTYRSREKKAKNHKTQKQQGEELDNVVGTDETVITAAQTP